MGRLIGVRGESAGTRRPVSATTIGVTMLDVDHVNAQRLPARQGQRKVVASG